MKPSCLLALSLALSPLAVHADTIQIPKEGPGFSVTVPDSWDPEETDKGFAAESKDKEATVIFESEAPKGLDALIDEDIDWLTKEQKVVIDKDSQKTNEFEAAGMKWSMIKWDGKDEEYGPATIMLVFAASPDKSRILVVTYWVTKKGEQTYKDTLEKIFDSVKWTGGEQ